MPRQRAHDDQNWSHLRFNVILDYIWDIVRAANNHIAQTEPWKLAKSDPEQLKTVLFQIWNILRLSAVNLYPFMPETAEKMWTQLGLRSLTDETAKSLSETASESGENKPATFDWDWNPGYAIKVSKGEQLFPRIEKDKKEKMEENKAGRKPKRRKTRSTEPHSHRRLCKGRTEDRQGIERGTREKIRQTHQAPGEYRGRATDRGRDRKGLYPGRTCRARRSL